MQKHTLSALGFLLLLATSSASHAGACTYREAIMALEQGNAVRGMALMRMASRDGDGRATSYLARLAAEREVALDDKNKTQRALALVDTK